MQKQAEKQAKRRIYVKLTIIAIESSLRRKKATKNIISQILDLARKEHDGDSVWASHW